MTDKEYEVWLFVARQLLETIRAFPAGELLAEANKRHPGPLRWGPGGSALPHRAAHLMLAVYLEAE